jgi:hypothetical protein
MLTRSLALLAMLSIPAWAGLTLTLAPPAIESGLPGDELVFQGTFSVDLGDPDVFLTDLGFTLTPPADSFLTPDTNPFFFNAPGDVCNNDPSCITGYTGDLFGIQIAPGTPAGQYFGTVTILGGADPSFSDPLTSAVPFEVDVLSSSPEPGSLLLIGPMLATGLAWRRKLSS